MGKNSLTRRGVLSLALAWPAAPGAAEAGNAVLPDLYAADPLTGIALRGRDAVSYALGDGPVPGREGIEMLWAGLTWRFAGPANRAAFAHDPEVYAPRLGGYDPLGVADGRLVGADPAVPLRRGDLLYLFRNPERRAAADPALLAAAEARWPALRQRHGV
ncbi:hypothetical protein [Methylobacterium sp. WSM2598]|uniref:hypothetical protein n=1 Tax=Methylobacterium sp. WSM2598 TaxID=398261 RepID=UPI000370859F|nr:hypothetical protein [Methylobacterium sp. WSM2598]